jgi:ferredoxin-NADP reductase
MKIRLKEKKVISKNTVSFYFEIPNGFSWTAGQYLHYKIEDGEADSRGQNRFFSIASAPFENTIQLTTRIYEDGSSFKKKLFKLSPGENIEVHGPRGDFLIREGISNYIFIAGGIGITPFRSIVKDLDHRKLPMNISLLYANKNQEIIFGDELETIASKHPEFEINYFISGAKELLEIASNIKIRPGRIDKNAVQLAVKEIDSTVFYVSGPETMVYYFEDLLADLGVLRNNILCDYYIGYKDY